MWRWAVQLLCLFLVIPLFGMDLEMQGHLRGQGSGSNYDADHFLRLSGRDNPFLDAAGNFRLSTQLYFELPVSLSIDYEAGIQMGDTRRALASSNLASELSDLLASPSDATRLLDLTHVSGRSNERMVYHRLDRLLLSWQGERSSVHIGRQALSWGNGLIFNPADLLNPFSPTDIIRDYKVGTDMILFQSYGAGFDDIQVAVVPRRDPVEGDVSAEQSSLAAKVRWSAANAEWDLLLARHYDESVIGAGVSGYIGGAAWRSDLLYTFFKGEAAQSGFFSAVVNIDYTWTLAGKNWYGMAEIFYNGAGESDPRDVAGNLPLSTRIARGELFTTGRAYVAAQLRYEHHPLVNFFFSAIQNVSDGSLILQPRVVWDARQDLQLILGADIPAGDMNSEFGGVVDTSSMTTNAQPVRIYAVVTSYF